MQNDHFNKRLALVGLSMFFTFSGIIAQPKDPTSIDPQNARVTVDSIVRQFSHYFLVGDSTALYTMYAQDGSFGCSKGNELRSVIGKMIRNSIQNNTRSITYKTSSVSVDSGLIVEMGIAEIKDDKGNLKGQSKYLVVYKQENGGWKLYRDIGL